MGVRKKLYKAAFRVLQRSGLGQAMAPITQGCGAIFMLHRVKPASFDPFQPNSHLEIEPEFLRQAVAHIRRNGYEIISIDEAVDLLKSGYGRKRYAVLSFDDGYRDNLEVAYPLLSELNAPFIVYVTSGLIDRTTELWWSALENIVAANDEIHLTGDGGGTGISCRTTEEKYLCYSKLCDFLSREVGEVEQRAIIRRLSDRYGLDLAGLADKLMMSWDEVRQLANDPLVTIGTHTYNHFAIGRLGAKEAFEDIDKGVARLETELGRRPKHFAYPYGNALAASARDAALLREYGFSSAVTTFPGVLKSANARDPMMLPRVSLNGHFQDGYIIDQYLTGAPFALYKSLRWLR